MSKRTHCKLTTAYPDCCAYHYAGGTDPAPDPDPPVTPAQFYAYTTVKLIQILAILASEAPPDLRLLRVQSELFHLRDQVTGQARQHHAAHSNEKA